MSKPDALNTLLSSDPNEPATNAVVLLLRAETKSEFKAMRSEMSQRFDQIEQSLSDLRRSQDFIAQQVSFLVSRAGP